MEQLPGTGNSQIELDFDNKYDREEVKCEHEEWAMMFVGKPSERDGLDTVASLIVDEAHEQYICARVKCEHCDTVGYFTLYADAAKAELDWE
jgi:hypothetical protein|tara:strand:+ start:10132 stop:10407 length:276 start_codon:yes stop_codon:yes gene_type:complete